MGMSASDNRDRSSSSGLDSQLLKQGIKQLELEIQTLTGWLQALGPSEAEPRLAYEDMLRSRREMLSTLQKQAERMDSASEHSENPVTQPSNSH
ncbi:hypothetical protein GCM10011403_29610 [Pseudohongiella nitratireducens]|uniref:Uncharacterized protein n=2 Tax=Pseudohongiella nitratireducens TaxID=1768907 RepID=A0A916VJU9_9GAMM|nr:hypothetical protein GCM10011403_29610 [Pseudohongiella nitratireducens]